MQYLFLASARCKQHTLFGIFSRPGKSHCKVSLPYMIVNCWSCQPVPGPASITYLNVLSILAPVIYLSVVSQCIPARLGFVAIYFLSFICQWLLTPSPLIDNIWTMMLVWR